MGCVSVIRVAGGGEGELRLDTVQSGHDRLDNARCCDNITELDNLPRVPDYLHTTVFSLSLCCKHLLKPTVLLT